MISEKLAKLINIKSIITLMVSSVFCYLAVIGTVNAEQFMVVFTAIIAFYFGVQTEKKSQEKIDKQV